MKFFATLSFIILQLSIFSVVKSQTNFWTDATDAQLQRLNLKRAIIPEKGRTLRLAFSEMTSFLSKLPINFSQSTNSYPAIISIPMPLGGFQNFAIAGYSIMEEGLARQVPFIKTYSGQGIDDKTATITIDISPWGFHAMILSPESGAVFIDPYYRHQTDGYISYYKKDFISNKKLIESEPYFREEKAKKDRLQSRTAAGPTIGTNLKTYRLAVACTGEYAVALGDTTKVMALASITTTINRVNGIYRRELSIAFMLVANNLNIVFIDPVTDGFEGNNTPGVLINESQTKITAIIGSANFDVGHTFSTDGGGLAGLGVVCRNTQKARGITGSPNPQGDPYDIDFVAHELGHQFGATHTFNGNTGNCETPNGDNTSNVEPGSGSTVMAYAGICNSASNLQANSDPQFHSISLTQINDYIINSSGNSCGVNLATGNRAPVVNAGTDFIIPRSTPFMLTGVASDADGDPLVYSWEQIDIGGPFGLPASPSGNAPIFRSFAPTSSAVRVFPRLSNLVANTTPFGEVLPTYARNINMRLTARDNRETGGGVSSDDAKLTVFANAGPFIVTSPNTFVNWVANSFRTITWNVNATDQAPISCANVSISLSLDGGFTYPVLLVGSTPNDGTEEIKVPANLTTQARIRVMAEGNIFFDISNLNFSIINGNTQEFVFNAPAPVTSCNGVNPSAVLRTSALAGFSQPIALSANAVPQGATLVFSNNPATPGTDVTVTLQGNLAPGIYTINVTGIANSVTKNQSLEYRVGPITATATLNNPANSSIGQPIMPNFSWSAIAGASQYLLEIADSPAFTNIVQTISGVNSPSFTLSNPLLQNTQYYWRVRASNTCGTGSASATNVFRTFLAQCNPPAASSDVPKVIAAATVNTITSTLNVASNVLINDLNVVGLKGTHEYITDITVSLRSPSNTSVILFDKICDGEQNFDLNLDDQSSTRTFPCPPIGGVTVQPASLLSAFNGQASAGTWTLTVTDNETGDGGSLTAWGLIICSSVATPLPVNWLSFTAAKGTGNSVNVYWSTANENQNNLYQIERSGNGIQFAAIGTLPGGNNPTMLQQYFYIDGKPNAGVNYYRLKQVDKDGQFTYSAIVKVILNKKMLSWSVYPNPAHGQTTVKLQAAAKKLNIGLIDALGKVVYRNNLQNTVSGQQVNVPLQGLATGLYILKVEADGETRTEKIVVN